MVQAVADIPRHCWNFHAIALEHGCSSIAFQHNMWESVDRFDGSPMGGCLFTAMNS